VHEQVERLFTGFGLDVRREGPPLVGDTNTPAERGASPDAHIPTHISHIQRDRDSASISYEHEKLIGSRRTNGSLNLKRLKAKHLRVIDLHCLGWRNGQIADELNMSQTYVSILLTDPLIIEQIQLRITENVAEFSALRGQAVEAVRHSLHKDRTPATRLKAADMFFKVEGDYARASENAAQETAEDVIQRMLQLNLQVNVTNQTGERSELPRCTPAVSLIESTSEKTHE